MKEENEIRVINISLDEARDLFINGNTTGHLVALKAFSVEDLIPITYEKICKSMCMINGVDIAIPRFIYRKIRATIKLATIAEYFNEGWQMDVNSIGYYYKGIKNENYPMKKWIIIIGISVNSLDKNYIYFKNADDIYKALKILNKEDIIQLNTY